MCVFGYLFAWYDYFCDSFMHGDTTHPLSTSLIAKFTLGKFEFNFFCTILFLFIIILTEETRLLVYWSSCLILYLKTEPNTGLVLAYTESSFSPERCLHLSHNQCLKPVVPSHSSTTQYHKHRP